MEEWRNVKGYEGIYMVSSLGRVKSLDRLVERRNGQKARIKGKIISLSKMRNGYLMVSLYKNGNYENKMVHQVVARSFLTRIKGKNEVNHINHVRDDNKLSNIERCTHQENMIDAVEFSSGPYQDSHNRLKTHRCVDCGKLITYKATRCDKCASIYYAKNHYRQISKDDLIKSLVTSNGNFVKAAKDYGITDNALRKWCRKYSLPTHGGDWKQTKWY